MKGRAHLIIGTLTTIEASLLLGLSLSPITFTTAAFLSVVPDMDQANSRLSSKIVSKDTTKKIHNTLMFAMLLASFYFYTKTGRNIYIGALLSIFIVSFLQKKITINHTRSLILSLVMLFIAFSLSIYSVNKGVVVLAFLIAIFPLTSHRSFTHSLTALLIFFILLSYIESSLKIENLAFFGTLAIFSHLSCDIITRRGIPLFYPFSKKNFSLGNLRVGSFLCNMIEKLLIFTLTLLIIIQIIIIQKG